MNFLLTLFFLILILGFLVLIHELGHFLAAKAVGVHVHEFAIGFGNPIFSKTYKGTRYKINTIPLGGYVQLEGEREDTGPGSFRRKPLPAKALVLLAGVGMNFIFACIFLTIFLLATGSKFILPNYSNYNFSNVSSQNSYFPISVVEVDQDRSWDQSLTDKTIVGINNQKIESFEDFQNKIYRNLNQDTEFEVLDLDTFKTTKETYNVNFLTKQGYFPINIEEVVSDEMKNYLKSGDVIIGIDSKHFTSFEDFTAIIDNYQNSEVNFQMLNSDGTIENRLVKLGQRNAEGQLLYARLSYGLGLGVSYDTATNKESYFLSYNKNLLSGTSLTYDLSIYQLKVLASLIGDAFKTGDYEQVSNAVGGVPRLGEEVGQVVNFQAFTFLIPLTALVSIALATANILPFPALDGGQLTIAIIESVTRRRILDKILNLINMTGFTILIAFSIFVTIKDVVQLGWIDSVGDFVRTIVGR